MEKAFAKFCDLLDDEIERQESLLAICRAQQEALLARDMTAMEARTAAMEALGRESARAQSERIEILEPIRIKTNLGNHPLCLSELIAVAPAAIQVRLSDIQVRLRKVIAQNRGIIRTNARLLRRSLRSTDDMLNAFQRCADAMTNGYTEQGVGEAARRFEPAVIDQRG